MRRIAIPRIYTKYVQIEWHLSLSATYGTHGEANLVSHLSHLCSSFLLGFHQRMIIGFGLWTILGTHIVVATYTLTCKSDTWNLLVRVRSYSFAVCTISNWFLTKYKGKIQNSILFDARLHRYLFPSRTYICTTFKVQLIFDVLLLFLLSTMNLTIVYRPVIFI